MEPRPPFLSENLAWLSSVGFCIVVGGTTFPPFACCVVVGVVTLGVGCRYPSKHTSHHTVFARTNDQVPVIWHEAKREQFDRILFESLTDNAQKCFVVFFFMKNCLTSIPTVEPVITPPASSTLFCRGIDSSQQGNVRKNQAYHTETTKQRPPSQ